MRHRLRQLILGLHIAASPSTEVMVPDVVSSPSLPGRVDDLARRFPGYVIPMLALTGICLLAAEAFLAWVVDCASAGRGAATEAGIIRIGWLLAAAAMMLAAWDLPLRRMASGSMSRRSGLLLLGAIAVAALLTAGLGKQMLIDHPVQAADGAMRRSAVQLLELARAVGRGTVRIEGFDLPSDASSAPQTKAVLALLPSSALPERNRSLADVNILLEAVVARDVGDAAENYNHVFIPSVRALRDAYNSYVAMQDRMVQQIDAIPTASAFAWQRYLDSLSLRGETAAHLPKRAWKDNAAAVQRSGVPVPDDWSPDNKVEFLEATTLAGRQQIDSAFAAETQKQFGEAIPPSLSWPQFLAVPAVQERWHADLHAGADVVLSPMLTLDQYKTTVYQPWLSEITRSRFASLLAPASAFAPGGSQAAAGAKSLRWLLAVPLLLISALAGVMFCSYRIVRYLLQIGCPRLQRRRLVAGAIIGGLVVIALAMPRSAPSGEAFSQIEGGIIAHSGMTAAIATWTFIQLYPWLYPAGEAIRPVIDDDRWAVEN